MDPNEHGPLAKGTIQELVDTCNRRRLSGAVHVDSSCGEGHIRFEKGQIVDAQLGSLRAEAALSRLVGAADGRYRVEVADPESGNSSEMPVRRLPGCTSSVSSWPAVTGKATAPRRASPQAKSAYAALASLKPLETVHLEPRPQAAVKQDAADRQARRPKPTKAASGARAAPQPAVTRSDPARVVPNMIVSVSRESEPSPVLDSLMPHAEAAAGPARTSVPPPAEDPHDLSPGAVVARYEVLSLLDSGSTGTVYLARLFGQSGFERLFALKILLPRLAVESDVAAALSKEAQVMSRVQHVNVVGVVDVGIHAGCAFVVINYLRSCNFSRLIEAKSSLQSTRTVVPVLLEALRGLAALHSAQDENRESLSLVHHDVNPQNFLVGLDGVCRLSDWGLAGLTELVSGTESGEHRGAPEFISPERARGEDVDARSDIFAFGALAWGALTGKSLFAGSSVQQTLKNVLELSVPAPSQLSNSPACLDAICLKALQRDPAKRFQTAAEMSDELLRVAGLNDLQGAHQEVAAWVKDVVGSGSNFSATRGGALAHEMARLDVLREETNYPLRASNRSTFVPEQPTSRVQLLQWTVGMLALIFLVLALLSPESLATATFGLSR